MKKKLTRVDAVLVAHHGLASLVWVVHVISCGHTGHVRVALVVRATLVVSGALVVWVASVIPCGLAGRIRLVRVVPCGLAGRILVLVISCGLAGCILVLVVSGGFAGVVSSFGPAVVVVLRVVGITCVAFGLAAALVLVPLVFLLADFGGGWCIRTALTAGLGDHGGGSRN